MSLYTNLLRETSCVLAADSNRNIVSLKSRGQSPHCFSWTHITASAGVLLNYPRFKWLPARLCLWPHHAISLVYVLSTLQISFRFHQSKTKSAAKIPRPFSPVRQPSINKQALGWGWGSVSSSPSLACIQLQKGGLLA